MAKFALEHLCEKTREQVARELGLSVQAVRWAEECALKKLRSQPELRNVLQLRIQEITFEHHRIIT